MDNNIPLQLKLSFDNIDNNIIKPAQPAQPIQSTYQNNILNDNKPKFKNNFDIAVRNYNDIIDDITLIDNYKKFNINISKENKIELLYRVREVCKNIIKDDNKRINKKGDKSIHSFLNEIEIIVIERYRRKGKLKELTVIDAKKIATNGLRDILIKTKDSSYLYEYGYGIDLNDATRIIDDYYERVEKKLNNAYKSFKANKEAIIDFVDTLTYTYKDDINNVNIFQVDASGEESLNTIKYDFPTYIRTDFFKFMLRATTFKQLVENSSISSAANYSKAVNVLKDIVKNKFNDVNDIVTKLNYKKTIRINNRLLGIDTYSKFMDDNVEMLYLASMFMSIKDIAEHYNIVRQHLNDKINDYKKVIPLSQKMYNNTYIFCDKSITFYKLLIFDKKQLNAIIKNNISNKNYRSKYNKAIKEIFYLIYKDNIPEDLLLIYQAKNKPILNNKVINKLISFGIIEKIENQVEQIDTNWFDNNFIIIKDGVVNVKPNDNSNDNNSNHKDINDVDEDNNSS